MGTRQIILCRFNRELKNGRPWRLSWILMRNKKTAARTRCGWRWSKLGAKENEIGRGGVYVAAEAIFQEGNPICPDEKSSPCRFYGQKSKTSSKICRGWLRRGKSSPVRQPVFRRLFYSPSMTASIRMPMMMMKIKAYCFLVSFSLRKMRERIRDTTHTAEMIGAAIAPLPLAMAYT